MLGVNLPPIGDPSNPDWIEARRLATNLLAGRIGGGDAQQASYEDALRWVNRQSVEVATTRLVFLAEALLRLATAAVAYADMQADNDERRRLHRAPDEVLDFLDRILAGMEGEGGDGFTVTP